MEILQKHTETKDLICEWNQFKMDYFFFFILLLIVHNGILFVSLLTITMLFSVGNRCVKCFINNLGDFKRGRGKWSIMALIDKVLMLQTSSSNQPTHTKKKTFQHKPDKPLFLYEHTKFKQTAVDSFYFYICCKVESGLNWISSSRHRQWCNAISTVYGPDCVFFVSFLGQHCLHVEARILSMTMLWKLNCIRENMSAVSWE